jgi:hypothetical protein
MRPSRLSLPVLATLLGLAGAARGDGPVAVLPPGQEPLLTELLGKGAALPGGCVWNGADVDHRQVTSRYACAGGEVIVELRYPTDAPPDAARTAHFALFVKQGAAPEGFLDALAACVRRHETASIWVLVSGVAPPAAAPALRWGTPTVVAAALLIAASGALAFRRATRRRAPPVAASWRRLPVALGAALVACLAAHGALRALGSALAANLTGGHAGAFLGRAALVLAGVLVAVIATAVVALTRGRAPASGLLGGVAALYVACAYPLGLPPDDLHRFGSLSTLPPGRPADPAAGAADVVNPLGFRGRAFSPKKRAGAVRVAIVGDSFVFGVGVADGDTIAVQLGAELARRWPGADVEVLNLGIPGNNLGSHVELCDAAARLLDPDVIVLGLTLVNDLSPWDGQTERRDGRRISAYSFARFLIGDHASFLWSSALEAREVSPKTLAFLDAELDRLARLRAAARTPPALVLLTWWPVDRTVESRLTGFAGATRAPVAPAPLSAFIPGDGHPTPLGARLFAGWAAEGIAASAAAPLFTRAGARGP